VSIVAFFDGTWGRVGRRLSTTLTSEMSVIVEAAREDPKFLESLSILALQKLDLDVQYFSNEQKLSVINKASKNDEMITGFLENSLKTAFPDAVTSIYMSDDRKELAVFVDTQDGLFQFTTSPKNIFSTSIFGFIAWMIGTSFLLFLVAVLFLRVQVRSIAELARVAEEFGRGIDNKEFKPYGSSEVRKAGFAFMKMKERIQKQISERTQMLAGVSHDLRTPLTRMKLQLEMIDEKDKEDMLKDILEMEKMLDGYLSFVSGEGGEASEFVDLNEMILSIINKFRNKDALIRYSTSGMVSAIQGREQALKRAVTNIISNAFDYANGNISVKLESNNSKVFIAVDDDGPGIPPDKREDVFKAFYRLEESRNKETGGVGLGLSIAKDVITSHGGTIELHDSKLGGLRVLVGIPLQ
jgi:two-component system osmolarity sensor histidine kinase EnvZ